MKEGKKMRKNEQEWKQQLRSSSENKEMSPRVKVIENESIVWMEIDKQIHCVIASDYRIGASQSACAFTPRMYTVRTTVHISMCDTEFSHIPLRQINVKTFCWICLNKFSLLHCLWKLKWHQWVMQSCLSCGQSSHSCSRCHHPFELFAPLTSSIHTHTQITYSKTSRMKRQLRLWLHFCFSKNISKNWICTTRQIPRTGWYNEREKKSRNVINVAHVNDSTENCCNM